MGFDSEFAFKRFISAHLIVQKQIHYGPNIDFKSPNQSRNESVSSPQMGSFRVPKRDHFGSPNGTISGPQMSPFRDSPNDPKMTTLGNGVIPTTTWGIARENAGLGPPCDIAQSPSHSLSHPSDGFATTPARGYASVRASVI